MDRKVKQTAFTWLSAQNGKRIKNSRQHLISVPLEKGTTPYVSLSGMPKLS